MPLPVLSWLSALGGRFGVSGEDPQRLVGGGTGLRGCAGSPIPVASVAASALPPLPPWGEL